MCVFGFLTRTLLFIITSWWMMNEACAFCCDLPSYSESFVRGESKEEAGIG